MITPFFRATLACYPQACRYILPSHCLRCGKKRHVTFRRRNGRLNHMKILPMFSNMWNAPSNSTLIRYDSLPEKWLLCNSSNIITFKNRSKNEQIVKRRNNISNKTTTTAKCKHTNPVRTFTLPWRHLRGNYTYTHTPGIKSVLIAFRYPGDWLKRYRKPPSCKNNGQYTNWVYWYSNLRWTFRLFKSP